MRNRTRAVKVSMLAVTAAIPLALGWSAARSHHAWLVMTHWIGGRAGTCTLAQSFEGERLSRVQTWNRAEMVRASRMVRQDGRYQLWNTPAGDFWVQAGSGEEVLYDLAEQKRNIYGSQIRTGDVVLDCGANVGVFTRKALSAGAGKVVAIEPAPENLECLRRNFAAEIADGRVVVYPKGVWDKDDVLKLAVDPEDSASDSFVRPVRNAQFIEVPLTTIDKLAGELHLPRVDVIKMDIEGAEQKAIAGARDTIVRYHPRMALCVYHLKDDPVGVPARVREIVPDYRFRQTCLCAPDRVQPEVALFELP
jgi:FkbM family methyltransferase